jgi:DNA-binding SARP family transcriptional activator
VDFRILGPLEVIAGGRSLPLGGAKQRALLALLLLHANEVVSTDRLLDDLWGDEPPGSGATALRVRVSQLRKALDPGDVLVTRAPGYMLRVGPDQLDLFRFERLVGEADGAEPSLAGAALREALQLWRGPALADVAYEPFAQAPIRRLEELRLVALERRIDSDLALGRQLEAAGELEALVAEHPLRERLQGQLMLALYRAGRQAEALAAYRTARSALVDALGIEPSRTLQELELAMLRHDPALDPTATAAPSRSLLVVPWGESVSSLLSLAAPLARRPPRELIVARVVERETLTEASVELSRLGVRAAAFTSATPGEDIVRLAVELEVDLLLIDSGLTPEAEIVLDGAPCDVALLPEPRKSLAPIGPERPVLAPFTGAQHDWAAVELAAWVAHAHEAPLRLAGASEGPGGRDASRLLASASLIVQRALGIGVSPLLVEPGVAGLVAAAEQAGLVVFGLPADWRRKGLGEVRTAVARDARPPTLLVRKGLRPSGLAPEKSLTRFTWSLGR